MKLCALAVMSLSLLVIWTPAAWSRSNQCTPVQAVFYTSGDWWRLAQTLAANPSSCAQYYISIPPLVASKTTIRAGAASQVRSLGTNFHALAEVNYSAWQGWVASTGNSWYQAGQEARRRMAAAGFDISSGDTWVVNEVSSAVVAGSGQARQNFRQLVAGLYNGDGAVAQAKGMVYAVGVGQAGTSLPAFKARLESWLQDSAFWTDMSSYVSSFYQEVYGDVRSYAVAGVNPATRIQYLNQYLGYLQQLAVAGPPSAATAQAYLATAFGPLANAAWAWNSDYGYTNVGSDVMTDYVSAETYAMRATGNANIGFAWDALNPNGLAPADFSTQTTGILTRIAGAIHETDGGSPSQACEATGCSAVLTGATAASGWSAFSTWTPTDAAFTNPAQTLTPGAPSGALTLQLQTGGVVTALPNPTTVTISSNSASGTFATEPGGPWTPTLTLTIPAASNGATLYTQDSSAGTPTLTANTGGQLTTQVETVNAPAPPVTVAPAPPPAARIGSITLAQVNGLLHLGVEIVDANGQPLQAHVGAAIVNGPDAFAATSGRTSANGWLGLTASNVPQPGCYAAQVRSVSASGFAWNGVTPTKTYCVLPSANVASLAFTRVQNLLHIEVRIVGTAGRPLQARVSFAILHDGSSLASTSGHTDQTGSLGMTAGHVPEPGCYRAQVRSVSAPGYTWNRVTPPANYCVQPSATVASLTLTRLHKLLHLTVHVVGTGGRPLQARVSVAILHGRSVFASTTARTTAKGRLALTARWKPAKGCYSGAVRSLAVPGYTWSGTTPTARVCVG